MGAAQLGGRGTRYALCLVEGVEADAQLAAARATRQVEVPGGLIEIVVAPARFEIVVGILGGAVGVAEIEVALRAEIGRECGVLPAVGLGGAKQIDASRGERAVAGAHEAAG